MSAVAALGSKRDEILLCTSQISLALRDLLLIKKTDTAPLLFYTDREEAAEMADKLGAARIVQIAECIAEVEQMISRNANAKLVSMKLSLCAFGERI